MFLLFPNYFFVQVDNVYQKVLFNLYLFLFLHHGIQKTKEHILHKLGVIVLYPKKSFLHNE